MVLEKTLESPLDCKEIQPVHSKGDQPWVFIGRTDATKIMASGPITSWEIDGETVETVSDFIFLGSKELMLLNCGVGEDSYESLELQGDPTSPF